MAEKTILDSKLVDLTGLGTFWGKVKEQIGNTETSANNYTDEKLGSFTQYDGDGNPIDGTPSGVRAEIENRDAAVLLSAQGYTNTAISNLSIDSYLKKTDEKVKDVDTTADKGVNLSLGTDGKLDVTVTPGSISKNNESVVTGGAVYAAIDSLPFDKYLKSEDQVVKSVDKTTFYGINLGYDDWYGVLNINVDAGNVVENDSRFVTGGTVHTAIGNAIDSLKIDDYLKSADQVVKDVETTFGDNGVHLTLDENGKLNVEVRTGVVGDGEEAVVTGDDVWSAIEAAKTDLSNDLSVTMTSTGDNTSGVKTYNFKQGGKDIGTINIPKDLVVSKGEVKICEKTDDPNYGKKCLELTLSSGDVVHIPVGELADVYTGDETYVTVSDSNVISLNSNFVDGLAKAGDSYLKTDTYNKKEVDDKFTNLPSYEAGAQVNKIEIVKVNDVALNITDKTVNIDLTPYLKSADQVVKSVDTTADKGVNISLGTDGKLDVTVDSGVVSSTETKLVTGSAVYAAIDNLKIDDYLKKDGITIASDDDILGIFED